MNLADVGLVGSSIFTMRSDGRGPAPPVRRRAVAEAFSIAGRKRALRGNLFLAVAPRCRTALKHELGGGWYGSRPGSRVYLMPLAGTDVG